MSSWEWLRIPGNVGTLPVRVLSNTKAEFVLDGIENIQITSLETTTDIELRPGDVCVLTAKITSVAPELDPVAISVEVYDVEFFKRVQEDDQISKTMKHLDDAKARRQEEKAESLCDNCRRIDGETRLSVETKVDGRELHFCGNCERLLSTVEYEKWREINEPSW